ncbi:hypothetical protein C2E23DRAFT_882279 [Lenzites betulinus]|nr:hypothetical protein C2E23DRAFT_882279 [Lenzites betulinus]
MSQGSHEHSLTNYGPESKNHIYDWCAIVRTLTACAALVGHSLLSGISPSYSRLAAYVAALGVVPAVLASPTAQAADSCAKIAGKTFAPPQDALACMKSFLFNE